MKKLINEKVKKFIEVELNLFATAYKLKDYNQAFSHLQRVHIVSQPYPIEHTLIHLRMLQFALVTYRPIEILVQIVYSMFSFKFSMLNIFPKGNTGGVNAVTKGRMEVSSDIESILL
jgi:Protein of unknown function (DUF3703)